MEEEGDMTCEEWVSCGCRSVMKEQVTEIVEDEYCRDDRRFSEWHIAKASRQM